MKKTVLFVIAAVFMTWGMAVQATVIEDFETDLTDYTFIAGSNDPGVSTLAAHDGSSGFRSTAYDQPSWAYRTDAGAQLSQGDIMSAWVRFGGVTAYGRAYLGFGASSLGTLSLVLAPNTNEFLFQENENYSYDDIGSVSQTYATDKWYFAVTEWGIGGNLTGKLYDSDGTTLLNTVTASSTLYTSGGIAFRGFSNERIVDIDTVSRFGTAVPEPTTMLLLGLGLVGLAGVRRRMHK